MKKYIQIIASVALAGLLTACGSESHLNAPEANDNTISFSAPFAQKNVSRALGDIDTDNFINSHFLVWGTATTETTSQTIFSETDVYYNGGVWTYDNPQQWDSSKKYKFAALAPSDNITKGNYSYYNNRFTLLNIPLSVKADEGVDYLVSNQVNTTYAESSGGVQLDFKHIMSRLRVKVKYASDDANLVSVAMNRLEINLPIGSARYEQTNEDGPSAEDKWTWAQNGTNPYTLCDEEMAVSKDDYQDLGNGFFVAPSPEDVIVTMNISYDVEIDFNGIKQTIPVTKENVEIPNFTSFKQGYISNLCLNIKPTGNDYAYIEINVSQQVVDHESNNGYINDKGQAFSIERLWQANNQICAEIDALDNEVSDGYYRLVSVLDSSGSELLNQENTFALNQVTSTGNYEISSNVNALLDAGHEYTFVIEDKLGNQQEASLMLDSDFGGASMQWTIQISDSNQSDRTFAIPFKTSGETSFTYRVDWGDGNIVDIPKGTTLSTSDEFVHQYGNTGSYTLTITSAIGDYTTLQIDPFVFGSYRGTSNGDSNYKTLRRLVSIDTPLLNFGTSADYIFKGCSALETLPKECFIYNEAVNSMESAFQNSGIVTLPQGIFDPLVNVENFRNLFNSCSKLGELPKALFAKNIKAYDFYYCFSQCTNVVLNEYLFISNESEKATRFANMTQPIDFTSTFKNCSNELSASTSNNVPELWEYTFGAGYTWKTNDNSNKYNPFYNISKNKYNNGSIIPTEWESGDAEGYEGYIEYPY